jgi:hypothetical protein
VSRVENVQQLTGKGVSGLEHCPPVAHFDLAPEELQRFLENPEETLTSIGLEPIPGLQAATIPYITLARPSEAYSEAEGWEKGRAPTGWCCYAGGDGGVICHAHG